MDLLRIDVLLGIVSVSHNCCGERQSDKDDSERKKIIHNTLLQLVSVRKLIVYVSYHRETVCESNNGEVPIKTVDLCVVVNYFWTVSCSSSDLI